jgi:hypothetical protein
MMIGNISLWHQLRQSACPTTAPIDGVFGTEAVTFIGLPALCLAPFAGASWWWVVLIVSSLLAMGHRTPLFRWTHWLHQRIPARYTYVVGLSLAMLALAGYQSFSAAGQRLVLLLQGLSLLFTLPRLWPMTPYCQRWECPSQAFDTPLTRFLSAKNGRVSGLPYPLRTGQINRIRTLGYNGGSQSQAMAQARGDPNPHGSGAHDWFALKEDGPALDAYGVRYAYTYRRLSGTWRPTSIPHLYENRRLS